MSNLDYKTEPPIIGEDNISVYIRLKRIGAQEKSLSSQQRKFGRQSTSEFLSFDDGWLKLKNYQYQVDKVLHDDLKDQKSLFDAVREKYITPALNGFRTSIFSYGANGSGKSYSMVCTLYYRK